MNMLTKSLLVAVPAALFGFLLQGPAPLGQMLWPMDPGLPEPEGAERGLLMLMGAIEAVAFGIGVAFLAFGLPWVRSVVGTPKAAVAVFLSIAWVLVNWVPHTALHMNHGNNMVAADYGQLVLIEYLFHFTLIIAGTTLVLFFVGAIGRARTAAAPDAVATA